jgi:hypothetical protein
MSTETKKGHPLCQVGSPKAKTTSTSYSNPDTESNEKRARQISERLAQMPRAYRGIYKRAVEGKSRKAAMHAFCAECCGYQIKEVFLCTDLGCPLYPSRPRSRVSQDARESVSTLQES